MVVWLKQENGKAKRLVDRWTPSIFVAADSRADLEALTRSEVVTNYALSTRFVPKYERIVDHQRSEVLEVTVYDAKMLLELARSIERVAAFDALRIYNADVPPAQTYLYERDLFPLAYCDVQETSHGLEWRLLDDTWAENYVVPKLRATAIDVSVRKAGAMARCSDPIETIGLKHGDEDIRIDSGPESEKILALAELIREIDPDFVVTSDGDTFLLPYLMARAAENGMADKFVLDRDRNAMTPPDRPGTSYFSYGRIYFKPSSIKLYGRVHLDKTNSFSYSQSGMDGLIEQSRICRQPFHTSSRASIGKALSSLQFYHATKMDILIPWKPTLAEHFKSRAELLVADRGGFIFEPYAGPHEGVAELDFCALYPNIMLKKNISAETVKCPCCPSSSSRVPELGWNVCERRKGVVPLTMEIIVRKRLRYKELKKDAGARGDREAFLRYDGRQSVLKWLGVTSFGYLGFNNAKFGRIDAHIAVCAWDRRILVDAMRVVEGRGFRVIHGIVDSLWLKKDGAERWEYEELKDEVQRVTGFEMSFEGIYKWVAFLSSKVNPRLPVQNRYFGAFRNGDVKIRGIEARRHDTPTAFSRCQNEILSIMAKADSVEGVKALVPQCTEVFLKHAGWIQRQETPAEELMLTRNLSHDPGEYRTNTVESGVVKQLAREGVKLHAGESMRYLVTDYDSGSTKRALPQQMVGPGSRYDARRYIAMLSDSCASVLEPFDGRLTKERLLQIVKASLSNYSLA